MFPLHCDKAVGKMNLSNQISRNTFLSRPYAPWLVCMTAALFFFYEFIEMNMFNTFSSKFIEAFRIDAVQLGFLSSFYFYADALFLLPAGMILDRFSTRRVILFMMLVCVIGTICFAIANGLLMAAFGRFLTGVGNAFCFLSCVRLTSRWFDGQHMALALGLVITIAMSGGAFAQTPLVLLMQAFGWRGSLLLIAGFGVVLMGLMYLLVYDYPPTYLKQHTEELETLQSMGVVRSLGLALGNPQNWFAGIYTSFLNLSIFIVGGLLGSLYLRQVYHFSQTQAATISMMVFVGTIIGSPLVGRISDELRDRRTPMIIGALLATIVMLLVIYPMHLSYSYFIVAFLLLGLFTSTQVLTYPFVAENNLKAVTSTAVGLSSMLIMAGGAVFQPLSGWLLQYHWLHTYRHHVPFYHFNDFEEALWILPTAFAMAFVASLLISESNSRKV